MEINKNKYLIKDDKTPKHEKSAAVNEIIKLLGTSKQYDYGYWLKKVGTASYSTVLGIVKEAAGLDGKYNRGGYITNKLKPYGQRKHYAGAGAN